MFRIDSAKSKHSIKEMIMLKDSNLSAIKTVARMLNENYQTVYLKVKEIFKTSLTRSTINFIEGFNPCRVRHSKMNLLLVFENSPRKENRYEKK